MVGSLVYPPEDPSPAWRPLSAGTDLWNILCRRHEAKSTATIQSPVNGQVLQLSPTKRRLSLRKHPLPSTTGVMEPGHAFHHTRGEVPCTPIPGRARPGSSITPGRRAKRERPYEKDGKRGDILMLQRGVTFYVAITGKSYFPEK